MNNTHHKTTHFGYQEVPIETKKEKVADVFHSVARQYDIMNDLMSFGIHRLWKRYTIDLANPKPGQTILDIAGGTGDLARAFSKRVGTQGHVVLADINHSMLSVGRTRLIDQGIVGNVDYIQTDAEQLSFPNNTFHIATMAFGLRNCTDKQKVLESIYATLKPGGQLLVLEFSKPANKPLEKIYDAYSFSLLPKMGEWIAKDKASYQYLAESIRMHPDQDALKSMMEQAGFERCHYHNLTGGIVALHRGFKY